MRLLQGKKAFFLMNDQNQNFNENDPNGSEQQERESNTEREPIRYEYIFSSSDRAYGGRRNPSNSRQTILIAAVCILLCAVIAFGAGFGGVWLARNRLDGSEYYDTNDTLTPNGDGQTGAPPSGDLYVSDPSSVLSKATSKGSSFGSAGEDVFSISQVAAQVKDAIVVINAKVYTTSLFGGVSESTSAGSGVIVSDTGYIVTCQHVVADAKTIQVTLNSGKSYEAALVGSDRYSDLAVLKIQPTEPIVSVKQGCSADLVVGEYVVAIGNPLGTLSGTVTSGIISATERVISMSDGSEMTLLQTDAAINSGNSGGGLFNLKGELIGIVNAKYASSGVEGLAFAIPIDSAYEVQTDLIQYGYRRNIVDTGIETLDITQSDLTYNKNYYASFGITEAGVYVLESKYSAELRNADRIVSINGVRVNTTSALNAQFKKCKVGDTVTILASRRGTQFSVQMTLREYIPDGITLQ